MTVFILLTLKKWKMKKMNSAKVVIELNYDREAFEDVRGVKLSDEEFVEEIEEMVYEDLTDLMRGDKLKYWSTITMENL